MMTVVVREDEEEVGHNDSVVHQEAVVLLAEAAMSVEEA